MNEKISKSGMTMRYPATRWQDALPTGSGIVGAMLYGNIKNDTILLNHDSLYSPETRPVSLDVSDKLAKKRDMINSGKCREAADLTRKTYADRLKKKGLKTEGLGVPPYQPFCSVFVKSETDGAFKNYRRGIDFSTGRAWMTYRDQELCLKSPADFGVSVVRNVTLFKGKPFSVTSNQEVQFFQTLKAHPRDSAHIGLARIDGDPVIIEFLRIKTECYFKPYSCTQGKNKS